MSSEIDSEKPLVLQEAQELITISAERFSMRVVRMIDKHIRHSVQFDTHGADEDVDHSELYYVRAQSGLEAGTGIDDFCDQWNFARMCTDHTIESEMLFKELYKQYFNGRIQPISDWLDPETARGSDLYIDMATIQPRVDEQPTDIGRAVIEFHPPEPEL